ncbi:MAG: dihydrolipoyl dehydrogenase, partial [Polyangiaceae bacterium]|nr:dihydrolipoyl dehydrogenase [Polyangiaceae bacterium]
MSHHERTVDVAVLGAGTAGLAAYRAARGAGAEALLIDPGPLGTTCARVGCMPSKLLIAAAEAAHDAREAGPFGLRTTVQVDGRAVMERVRRERDRFVGFVLEGVDRIPGADLIAERGRFAGPGLLEAGAHRIRARSVVLATGSSPAVPPLFEPVRPRVIVNDDVFSWETLPSSVAVFGAGVIGLELGQALHRLGVRVRIFGLNNLVGPLSDPIVRQAAAEAFREELPCDLDARDVALTLDGDAAVVRWSAEGHPQQERFEWILVATGRRPNLASLNLEAAAPGAFEGGRLQGYDRTTMQLGAGPIFLAGDVNGDLPLLHEAADEGRIAGENAARFPAVQPGPRRTPLAIVFSDPQLAVVGSSFAELTARGGFLAGAVSFADQGRSRVMRRNRGALR